MVLEMFAREDDQCRCFAGGMVSAPLKVIRGRVQELAVTAGEEELTGAPVRAVGAGAAVGLAAVGLRGAAVGASMAATARSPVQFFDCTVGGQRISGRFSKVTFKDGDEVEVVIEPQWDGTQSALAVRRLSDRVLWMLPHCSRGTGAHGHYAFRLFPRLLVGFLALFCGAAGVMEWRSGHVDHFRMWRFFTGLIGVNALFMAAYFSIRYAQTWRPHAARAEAIFAVLGYREPSRVDLENDHKRACRALGEKWPYLSDGPWIYRYSNDPGAEPGSPH